MTIASDNAPFLPAQLKKVILKPIGFETRRTEIRCEIIIFINN
jgi:hypothetical protein